MFVQTSTPAYTAAQTIEMVNVTKAITAQAARNFSFLITTLYAIRASGVSGSGKVRARAVGGG